MSILPIGVLLIQRRVPAEYPIVVQSATLLVMRLLWAVRRP
jgi:hypothetical protein